MRNRWFHRAVLQYSFDEVSDGFYVNAMEANTDPESFVYDIRLRLKFSDDAILTSKTNSQWSAYTKTVLEANKYIQARAEARII